MVATLVINCMCIHVGVRSHLLRVERAMKNVQIRRKSPRCLADGRLTGIVDETVTAGSSIFYLHLLLECKQID